MKQYAIQDQNRFPALLGHSGTAGTADTIRLTANSDGSFKVPAELGSTIVTNSHTGNVEIRTYQENHICTDNSTMTPLGAGSTFTGDWQDCLDFQELNVSVVSDKNSATNGLIFQWSADGTTVGDTDVFSYYTASGGTNYTPNPSFRYVRMVYINGSQAQTTFNLQTILRRGMTGGSFHRIDTTLKDDNDARLTITVPKLKTAANTYVSQNATTAGNAKMSLEELESGVSSNNNSQLNVTPFHADGTEGNLITGIDYVSGKSGIDSSTETLQVIEYEHHEIHSGSYYRAGFQKDIPNGGTAIFAITTPNTTSWLHFRLAVDVELESTVMFYENPTSITGGTSITPRNANRNSANTSGATVVTDPTVDTTGAIILGNQVIGSGKSSGGNGESAYEFVLKQNEQYLIIVTNNTTSNNQVNIRCMWYEHTNKN